VLELLSDRGTSRAVIQGKSGDRQVRETLKKKKKGGGKGKKKVRKRIRKANAMFDYRGS